MNNQAENTVEESETSPMKMNRVLIVDDNLEILHLQRVLLQDIGYTVFIAINGADALEIARQNPPNLIISDLAMPVMDGFAFLRNCKADELLKTIPFVVYTATFTDDNDKHFALELGADDFIIKPTEWKEFISRINNVLLKRGEQSPPVYRPESDQAALLKEYSGYVLKNLWIKTGSC